MQPFPSEEMAGWRLGEARPRSPALRSALLRQPEERRGEHRGKASPWHGSCPPRCSAAGGDR